MNCATETMFTCWGHRKGWGLTKGHVTCAQGSGAETDSQKPRVKITGSTSLLTRRHMQRLPSLVLLTLAGLCLSAALPPTAAPLFTKPFVVLWNAPIYKCDQLQVRLDMDVFQAITTPAKVPNQTLTLFYKNRIGRFPYTDLKTLTQYNGGIPQKGDLNASLQKAKTEFNQYIPSSVPGLAVLDWEEWFPLFDRNADLREIYKSLSINYTLQQNPSLTREQATLKAKEQFNEAARSFMEETLKLGISQRPNFLWGYYLYPDCYNYDYENPSYTGRCSQTTIELNTELHWLWEASTAFFPSAYMPVSISTTQKAALFIRNQVLEAMRVAGVPRKPYTAPVYLYLRPLLQGQKEQYMQEVDLIRSIGESAALGTAGCVLWGSSYDFNDKASCEALSTYLSSTLNKYVVNVTTAAELCSDLLCGGNGRCVRKIYDSDDYLHLNINSFNIQKIDGMYKVFGKPSKTDLTAWSDQFTCQCYEDKKCSAQIPSGFEYRERSVTGHLTVLLAVYILGELS
ncbi:hyaluronidase-1-like isoform X1 [Hemibagrus wyckioides]|uniref:hyaluronidase-1-like isoform X1 n=1 Tax=Hemibagrus wyckioides TaxID=337641 RepID=UPI00266BCF91|nr:hyaluronidase-1-like isoform X1 [Hemibagrus wyckioides]